MPALIFLLIGMSFIVIIKVSLYINPKVFQILLKVRIDGDKDKVTIEELEY
mgnify:CR=1 FL=1